jgi:hypothetical protein
LLERKEFAEIWAMKWSELLMVKSSNQVSYKSMFLYSNWLTDKIANNVPLDQMVRELLRPRAARSRNPATNFYQIERDTLKTAENVAQVFMGIRTQCAQCHNHPFDRWTMDDYYSFAAFFSQIGRKQAKTTARRSSSTAAAATSGIRSATADGSRSSWAARTPDVAGQGPPRSAGRMAHLAGQSVLRHECRQPRLGPLLRPGIVEPVDDIRVSNPPSNPELFETGQEAGRVQVRLQATGARHLQLARLPAQHGPQREQRRRRAQLRPRQRAPHSGRAMLLDCISQVTETKEKFRGLPLGARAVQIADGTTSNYFLTTFGRAKRETVCACEAKTDPTLSQALHMLNGDAVHGKIAQGGVVKEAARTRARRPNK